MHLVCVLSVNLPPPPSIQPHEPPAVARIRHHALVYDRAMLPVPVGGGTRHSSPACWAAIAPFLSRVEEGEEGQGGDSREGEAAVGVAVAVMGPVISSC